MRLIDADALRYCNYDLDNYHSFRAIEDCEIEVQPTIDAVPVVRCKECVHWYDRDGVCLKIYDDGSVSPYAWQFRNEDDFCSYGERRSE